MNICSFEYMFIIIKERMFVNTKYEQIFETFVCVPVGFMVKFIWYILSKYRIERGDYPKRQEEHTMAGDKNKLTEKQRQILEYLKQEILQRGFPPSVREICEAVSLRSTSSVHAHLETLERKGYIKRDATKPRAIEICDEGFHTGRLGAIQGIASEDTASQSEVAQIPLIGKVAAGEPILAVENIEGYFPMPVDRLPNAETFLLKVQGESMVNAGILDGDLVLVEQQATAENGEKIVALVNDSATVKTFYKEDGYFRLQPENDEMDPILVNDLQIVGKVIGVLRFLS